MCVCRIRCFQHSCYFHNLIVQYTIYNVLYSYNHKIIYSYPPTPADARGRASRMTGFCLCNNSDNNNNNDDDNGHSGAAAAALFCLCCQNPGKMTCFLHQSAKKDLGRCTVRRLGKVQARGFQDARSKTHWSKENAFSTCWQRTLPCLLFGVFFAAVAISLLERLWTYVSTDFRRHVREFFGTISWLDRDSLPWCFTVAKGCFQVGCFEGGCFQQKLADREGER